MMEGMSTPWGPAQEISELAHGIWSVRTARHGGLCLSEERWQSLPEDVRATFYEAGWAEEDCEEVIVLALFGMGDEYRDSAIKVAQTFETYRPALEHLTA